jgi:small subunit ribosomal protein S1
MKLSSGDIIDVRVTHLEQFGCFCDIGCGIVSLIPINCISISRISHSSDHYQIGQLIKAAVKFIDRGTGKVSLTHKELLGTWEENASKFQQGQTVCGIVRGVEEYGIFVELAPNLAGLAEPKDGVFEGQKATVFIKNIIPERMKMKLVVVETNTGEQGVQKPAKPQYYIDSGHIDTWRYSPANCEKVVETIFSN